MTAGSSDRYMQRFIDIAWSTPYARLITVNCAAFLLLTVANLVVQWCGGGVAAITPWVAMPGDCALLLTRPWTVLTYMFVNTDLFRLIFNMLWLLCFGRLLSLPLSAGRVITLYIVGGVAGAAAYLVGAAAGWWPGVWLIGPSAAVMAVVVAATLLLPRLDINLLIIGNVKVFWVGLCVLLIYFLDIDGANPGGNAAHAGGALAGLLMVLCRRFDSGRFRIVRQKKTGAKSTQKQNRRYDFGPKPAGEKIDPRDNARLDAILDKVKRAGYGALSADEKAELFDISRRIK